MNCREVTLKSGKKVWECVADGPTDPVTGERKQIRRRAKRQKDAKQKVRDEIDKRSQGMIDSSIAIKVTFQQAAQRWLDIYSLTGVKESTLIIRRKEIKILKKHMAMMPMVKITHSFYQDTINKIAKKYERNTILGVHSTAGMIFKQAVKDGLIDHNPTKETVIPRKRKTVEEIESDPIEQKYLEHDELIEFLRVTKEKGLKFDFEWFNLLAFSGMRSGELLALKWTDINFETNEIRVTKTYFNAKNNMREYELTPPKTNKSARTFVVEDEVMKLLENHQKEQQKFKMKYRHEIEEYHDGNFVFARPNGYPYNLQTLDRRMKRIIDLSNIKKNATPHFFRHTHISMMTEAGIDLPTIMDKIGHDDMQTTMRIYTHITNKMRKNASEKMRNLYKDTLTELEM